MMKTLRSEMIDTFHHNGLFEHQAAEIMDAVEKDPANDCMLTRWKDDVEGYPAVMIPALWFGVTVAALRWIDGNCPKHWARPLFEKNSQLEGEMTWRLYLRQ